MAEKFLQAVRKGLEERDRQMGLAAPSRQEPDARLETDDVAPAGSRAAFSPPRPSRAHLVGERADAIVVGVAQRGGTCSSRNGDEAHEVEIRAPSAVHSGRTAAPPRLLTFERRLTSNAVPTAPSSFDNAAQQRPFAQPVHDDLDDEVIDLVEPTDDDVISLDRTNIADRGVSSRPATSQPSCPLPSLNFDDVDDDGLDYAPLGDLPLQPAVVHQNADQVLDADRITPRHGVQATHGTEPVTTTKRQMKTLKPEKPAKRQKVEKAPKEKRGVNTRGHPSKAVLDRLIRSKRHRLFLVDKKDEQGKIVCAVMGSNGNIYKCQISVNPSCDCPDFQKRKALKTDGPCKHLIFLFLRVLKVPREDPKWWQARLLSSELKEIMESAPKGPVRDAGVMAQDAVLEQYQQSSQDSVEEGRRALEGECTICYEDLVAKDGNQRPENRTTYCKKCGNNFHSMCMQNWHRAQSNPTCPLCCQDMGVKGSSTGDAGEGFLNLAQYSTAHERQLTLSELYANTRQYIGRGGFQRRGGAQRGRARGRRRGRQTACTG